MQALLSFDKSPPLAAPFRFFLTAPLMGMLAALLFLLEGEAILASRWTPAALAVTHLLTLGFLAQVMLGALIQILPVVAGANLPAPLWVARLTHAGLLGGTLLLVFGFLWGSPTGLLLGGLGLALSICTFLAISLRALWAVPSTSPTIRSLKLALLALLVVVALGGGLVSVLVFAWGGFDPRWVDLHAAWGLAGWGAALVVALSLVVVPMFQLTPGYPARFSWFLVPAVFAVLIAWSLVQMWADGAGARFFQAGLAVVLAAFALLTLRLQAQRRRARADATYRYWQFGLLSAILACAMQLTVALRPAVSEAPAWSLAFGMLVLVGAFMSFIVGMLYKILPFLAWLHLQNLVPGGKGVPAMNRLLPEAGAAQQFWSHVVLSFLLLLAVIYPLPLTWVLAGLAGLFSQGWLLYHLWRVAHLYWRHLKVIQLGKAAA